MSLLPSELSSRLGLQPAQPPDIPAVVLTETHVVELPPAITSSGLRQVVGQFATGRVILQVPPGASELAASGAVPFQILRRQSEAQRVPVAIATRDPAIRGLASAAGLPVYGTIQGALDSTWHTTASDLAAEPPPPPPRSARQPVSDQRRAWLSSRFRRVQIAAGGPKPLPWWLETAVLAVALVLSILAVTGAIAFIVPVANVTLIPAQEPVTATITVTARPDVEAVDSALNVIPARRIGQRVEGDDVIETTGTGTAADARAQGTVVFTNRGPAPQQIPAGTTVATSTGSNARFQTLASVELPGGVGAQVVVPIEALEPGPAGNARAGTINTVEGGLGALIAVINPEETGGGNVKQVAVVTQGDKDRLRNRLLQQVTQKSYLALGELLEAGEFVPPETVGILVVDETYDRFIDEEAEQLFLGLRLLATALAVDGTAADELALQALGDSLPRRGRLLADTVRYSRGPATVTELEDGTPIITFDVTASGQAVPDVDPAAVRAAIRGQRPPDAVDTLQNQWRLQAAPELAVGPDWLMPLLRRFDFDWLPLPVADRVPWLPFRTHVRIELAS